MVHILQDQVHVEMRVLEARRKYSERSHKVAHALAIQKDMLNQHIRLGEVLEQSPVKVRLN